MIVIRPLLIICFIAGAINIGIAAPITAIDPPAPEPTPDAPADNPLTPGGGQRLDGDAHSRLDLSGRNVTLDPHEEPMFSPQSQSGGWQNLGIGPGLNGSVSAIAVSGTDIYVGGDFTNAGGSGARYLARWDGNQWRAVGSAQAMNNWVLAIGTDVIDGADHIYVGGEFTNANGGDHADYIVRWDGEQWLSLRAPSVSAINGPVSALAVSGSNVYIGGNFTNVGGVDGADYLARWDGRQWHAVGAPGAINGPVNAIAVSGTDVYVGGRFTNAGGVSGANNLARWDGTNWNIVGGANAINDDVEAIAISGSTIYVGGRFTNAGGVTGASRIARWDGTQWHALGNGNQTINSISAIAISGNDVYVGGSSYSIGGVSDLDFLARWDGTQWHAVGGTNALNDFVNTLAIVGSNVYVGGYFVDAGGNPYADYVARLTQFRVYLPLTVR